MPRKIIVPLLSLLTLLLASEAGGTIRYVSRFGGSDSNPGCTQAAPCRTISHAVQISDAGDAISIGKGKFDESLGVAITKNLTVNGAGKYNTSVTVGWPAVSVFWIATGTTATITGLHVSGGGRQWQDYGPALHGGGISNHGHLTLKDAWVGPNSAYRGGGIFNDGLLLVSDSEIVKNSAQIGGGLDNSGIASLDRVRIAANDSVVDGGGIQNGSPSGDSASNLTVERSVIADNHGTSGIVNLGWMSLINTTVSGNPTGGVWLLAGFTKLTHVTVAENGKEAPSSVGAGLSAHAGDHSLTIDLINTIVANNGGQQCRFTGPVSASITGSLFSDLSCGNWFPSGTPGDNLVTKNPKLLPLKWSKLGNTYVHALKPDSPAVDAGDPAFCVPADQRGMFRPIDGDLDGEANCDIGAYEYLPKWLELEQ